MKKLLLAFLCVLLAGALVLTGCKKKSEAAIKIGVAVPTADHGWTGGIGWWADYAVNELKGQYP
ncbi:MAG: LacI family transcriptional regulator, partial [Treponema sp.]|nr:LacI family transcriptional regulator [Treponema sp.]